MRVIESVDASSLSSESAVALASMPVGIRVSSHSISRTTSDARKVTEPSVTLTFETIDPGDRIKKVSMRVIHLRTNLTTNLGAFETQQYHTGGKDWNSSRPEWTPAGPGANQTGGHISNIIIREQRRNGEHWFDLAGQQLT